MREQQARKMVRVDEIRYFILSDGIITNVVGEYYKNVSSLEMTTASASDTFWIRAKNECNAAVAAVHSRLTVSAVTFSSIFVLILPFAEIVPVNN